MDPKVMLCIFMALLAMKTEVKGKQFMSCYAKNNIDKGCMENKDMTKCSSLKSYFKCLDNLGYPIRKEAFCMEEDAAGACEECLPFKRKYESCESEMNAKSDKCEKMKTFAKCLDNSDLTSHIEYKCLDTINKKVETKETSGNVAVENTDHVENAKSTTETKTEDPIPTKKRPTGDSEIQTTQMPTGDSNSEALSNTTTGTDNNTTEDVENGGDDSKNRTDVQPVVEKNVSDSVSGNDTVSNETDTVSDDGVTKNETNDASVVLILDSRKKRSGETRDSESVKVQTFYDCFCSHIDMIPYTKKGIETGLFQAKGVEHLDTFLECTGKMRASGEECSYLDDKLFPCFGDNQIAKDVSCLYSFFQEGADYSFDFANCTKCKPLVEQWSNCFRESQKKDKKTTSKAEFRDLHEKEAECIKRSKAMQTFMLMECISHFDSYVRATVCDYDFEAEDLKYEVICPMIGYTAGAKKVNDRSKFGPKAATSGSGRESVPAVPTMAMAAASAAWGVLMAAC